MLHFIINCSLQLGFASDSVRSFKNARNNSCNFLLMEIMHVCIHTTSYNT